MSIRAAGQHSYHPTQRATSAEVIYDVHVVRTAGGPEVIHQNFRTPLRDTQGTRNKLRDMLSWQENWNGYDASRPNPSSIQRASRWISKMRMDASATGKPWREPHVVPDENGDIAFEWWNDGRNLTVYVSPNVIDYLKVWGSDIDSEMEDGLIATPKDDQALWHWLTD